MSAAPPPRSAQPALPAAAAGAFISFVTATMGAVGLLVAGGGPLPAGWRPSLPVIAALIAAGAVTVPLVRDPQRGLSVLAAFVYLNLSQVLVREHGWPSLLPLLVVALGLGSLWRRPEQWSFLARQPLTLALAAYTLVVFVSTTVAVDRQLADAGLTETVKALCLFALAAAVPERVSAVRRCIWALLGAGTVLAVLALYQATTGSFSDEYGGLARIKQAHIYGDVFEPRIAGPLGDPNFFAQVLVMLVPLGLFLGWDERRRLRRWLAFGAAALTSAAAVLTYSRGGALALAAVVALSLAAHRVHLRQVAAGAAAIALLFLLVPADFTRRLTTVRQILGGDEDVLRPDSSFEKRRLLTGAAWSVFAAHPILGVGKANYTVHFEEHAERMGTVQREQDDEEGKHYPHSLYLEVAAETGLVGLLAFAAALAAAFVELRLAQRRFAPAGSSAGGALARGLEVALVGYLLSSLFLHGHFQRYLWLVLGLSAALGRLAREGDAQPAVASRTTR